MTTSDKNKLKLIQQAEALFGREPRPEHFTNHLHCCECAEHDETLQAHTPQTIGLKELGSPAWDPACFMTAEAFRYYFPAMIRLVLLGTGDSYYADQFLFHLTYDGARNRRWQAFNIEERNLVVNVLELLLEEKLEEIENGHDADNLATALEIWSDNGDGA